MYWRKWKWVYVGVSTAHSFMYPQGNWSISSWGRQTMIIWFLLKQFHVCVWWRGIHVSQSWFGGQRPTSGFGPRLLPCLRQGLFLVCCCVCQTSCEFPAILLFLPHILSSSTRITDARVRLYMSLGIQSHILTHALFHWAILCSWIILSFERHEGLKQLSLEVIIRETGCWLWSLEKLNQTNLDGSERKEESFQEEFREEKFIWISEGKHET